MSEELKPNAANYARIDYGYGIAQFWGDFTADNIEQKFMHYANQCFGIRKSICDFKLLLLEPAKFPPVFGVKPNRIAAVLKHSGDTIVWGKKGHKIKSEWD